MLLVSSFDTAPASPSHNKSNRRPNAMATNAAVDKAAEPQTAHWPKHCWLHWQLPYGWWKYGTMLKSTKIRVRASLWNICSSPKPHWSPSHAARNQVLREVACICWWRLCIPTFAPSWDDARFVEKDPGWPLKVYKMIVGCCHGSKCTNMAPLQNPSGIQ